MNFKASWNAIILFICGSVYGVNAAWGLIETYMTSYLIHYNPFITTSIVHSINIVLTMASLPSSYTFLPMTKFFGYKETIILCMFIGSFGLFICSWSTAYWGMFLGILVFGYSKHLFHLTSSQMMMLIMPNNLSLGVALSYLGASFSTVYWSMLAVY